MHGIVFMGAWGFGLFENDDAAEWLANFVDRPGKRFMRQTFRKILSAREHDDYLEAPDCSKAVAAAEVVAALSGSPSLTTNDELTSCLTGAKIEVDPQLIEMASTAISRILTDSELKELWEEAGSTNWGNVLADLQRRLTNSLAKL